MIPKSDLRKTAIGAMILLGALTLLSCVSSFVIYRSGFADLTRQFQTAMAVCCVVAVEGCFAWLLYGFATSFSSAVERGVSMAGIVFLFSTVEVAIPRRTEGPRKVAIPGVAIPQEGAGAHQWAIPREGARGDAWAIPGKGAERRASGTKAGKLKLAESRAGARKSWTIPTCRESGEALRVRRSDAGFAVSLRFRDQSDELREPYLCYLTASEWSEARQGSIGQMARLVSEKMRKRKDASGLAELIN